MVAPERGDDWGYTWLDVNGFVLNHGYEQSMIGLIQTGFR